MNGGKVVWIFRGIISLYEEMKSIYFDNAATLIIENISESCTRESELNLLISSMFVLSYRKLLPQDDIINYISQIGKNADTIKNKQLSISLVGLFSMCLNKGLINRGEKEKVLEEMLEKSLKKLSKKYESVYIEAFSAQTPDDLRKKQLADNSK